VKTEYQIRELVSVGRQVYGKLLYATRNFDDALEHLLLIQNRDRKRKIGLLVTNGDRHEKRSDSEDRGSRTDHLV
jgi:hypothetical protein